MKLFLPHTYPFVTQVTPRYALRHSPFRAGPTLASRDSGETYLAKLNPSHLCTNCIIALFILIHHGRYVTAEFWTYVEKSFTWTDLPSKFPIKYVPFPVARSLYPLKGE
ncbi:Polycomb group protein FERTILIZATION-INDEPENDENT ENDOSPERM [Glycine soja]|uniref:Polycomb group protein FERTILIZATION-INDEPENDENT ENDOSPERM n=1 Tax=Glycine soja TaxID=3848 RepID=A0A0B2Q1Z1_GLYSO|nr:Polycomb group protein FERTILIZATION-INDEPENDENT ENDOSPERM [Glycine soja]